jgi:hypothetical protein
MRLRDIPYQSRVELLEPEPQRPSRRYLLQLATTNLQSFFNQISATGRAWSVCDNPLLLTVGGGVTEYLLPVGDEWGRPLDVTTYSTDPSHVEQPVSFTELADQKFDSYMPRNSGVMRDAAGHSAVSMAFYKKGFQNSQYVSVYPAPQTTSTYRVLYSLGSWASDMALDDSPLMAQHHSLLVVKTALDALPASAWWADEKDNRLRRSELRESLSMRMPTLLDDFKKYIRSISQPRMTFRNLSSID